MDITEGTSLINRKMMAEACALLLYSIRNSYFCQSDNEADSIAFTCAT
jgi:hypothetical protein